MSRILRVAVAASLLATGMAGAQDQPNRPGDRGQGQERPQGNHRPPPNPGNRPPGRPPAPPPRPRPPSWGHRPPHHYLSQGRWRPSMRGPAFRYPPGFGYRRWVSGAVLPSVFLSSAYFNDNYAPLGLGPPPPGYRWVRYGPDLLLVNVVTGRIADVVDGAFY